MNFSSSPQQLGKNWLDLYGLSPLNRQRPLHPLHYHHRSAVQSPIPAKERGQKKNGIMWGKFPKRGEGSDPNPLHIFSVFSNSGAYKMAKRCQNSQTGGRESATWEFFPHNPVFSDHVPKTKGNCVLCVTQ